MARYSGSAAAGGAAAVQTVNGVAPVGGDVTLEATDIPYTPTYADLATTGNTATTVGGQLLFSETRTGTMSWLWDEPTMEAAFPVGAIDPNTHTVNRPAFMLTPLGGAPIALATGNDVKVANPGSIDTSGVQKVLLTGDVAGPLLKGEVVASGLGLLNTSIDPAAKDMQVESLAGRVITQTSMATLGKGGVVLENIFGAAALRFMVQAPSAAGATGVTIDGVIGAVLIASGFAQAPPGGGYVAIDVLSTAAVSNILNVEGYGSVTLDPSDAFTRLDPAATLPGGPPLPASQVGTRYFGCTNQGLGVMFGPGIGPDDIRVFSSSHQSGPRSNWIGDARLDTAGAPPDASLDHSLSAGLPLTVPADNAQNGGAGGTLRTLTLTGSPARHSLLLGLVETASVNAGGTYTGADGPYPATQASTSGSGTGAEFTVTLALGAITAVVSVDKLGEGYAIGDTITLLVGGPTEVVAAVLDVDNITWLLRTDGPVDDLTGSVGWLVDHQRQAAAGSFVFGFLERRKAGAGAWVEVPNTRSIPQVLANVPTRAAASTTIDDIGVADEWRVAWVNDVGGSAGTLFTIIEIIIEGQP